MAIIMNKEEIDKLKTIRIGGTNYIIAGKYTLKEIQDFIDKQTKEIEFQKDQRKIWRDNYYEEQAKNIALNIKADKQQNTLEKILNYVQDIVDNEIMNCCEMFDVNGIEIRKDIEKIIGEVK